MAARMLSTSKSGSIEEDYFMDESESCTSDITREESMGLLFREESARFPAKRETKLTDVEAFEPLTMQDIIDQQRRLIEEIMEVTALPAHMARTFLQEMKWDKTRLTESYYEDADRALAKAGLALTGDAVGAVELQDRSISDSKMLVVQDKVTCQICLDDFEGVAVAQGMTVMPHCGHMFCNDCWRSHLRTQIAEEGEGERIKCAGRTEVGGKTQHCNIIMDEAVVEGLLSSTQGDEHADLVATYRKRLTDSYVTNSPSIKWCPGTDCSHAVRVIDAFDKHGVQTQVQCPAGHVWCFLCNEEPHGPAECELARMWKQKCMDDSETCVWLQTNTKDCPNCSVAINKDGGCNHMHCKRCDTHFCWLCLGSFKNYSHQCNAYKEEDVQVQHSRAMLQRYAFHYERYMAHHNSSKLEDKVRELSVEKMKEMQDAGHKTYMEVVFMKEATDRLMLARRILKWTYVVCFYEPTWLIRNMLENHQAELESATEELSGMVEGKDIMKWCETDERIRMMDQTNKVASRTAALFKFLQESKAAAIEAGQPVGAAAVRKGGAGEQAATQAAAAGGGAA